jgi:light-regulated signal transduction histidine kinase (bacteriophytochrome)
LAPLAAVRKDGTEFSAEISLHPIAMHNGKYVLSVVRDVTERLESQRAIQRYTEELRRSNADLEQFAYIASHDLQEPLRMIASYTELLSERYSGHLDETADKYIHFAVDGAKRMKRLINALLEYSRVDKQSLRLEPTDTKEVVNTVVTVLDSQIKEKKAVVHYDGLPKINVDRNLIELLFQNLLNNAIKFHSELPPRIKVTAEPNGDMCVLAIEDNGIGIDEKYADRVFQMFQRLNPREAYEGNGIGLSVARRIVERHGGRIWFKSRPLIGTTFYFTLPLNKDN